MSTGATWRLWRWPWRTVAVRVCPYCAALVAADGVAQHELTHRAERGDDR